MHRLKSDGGLAAPAAAPAAATTYDFSIGSVQYHAENNNGAISLQYNTGHQQGYAQVTNADSLGKFLGQQRGAMPGSSQSLAQDVGKHLGVEQQVLAGHAAQQQAANSTSMSMGGGG